MLKIIRTTGLFVEIVGFFANATVAYTLVSFAERQASSELMQKFQINPTICSFCISIPV
jgi:hypothetical protein